MEQLPLIDEHTYRIDAPADVVWEALLWMLRRRMAGGEWFAQILGCEPVTGTAEFAGNPGDALPGFRVVEAERGRRLVLRGRHRFSEYALTFVLDDAGLHAESRAAFPGVLGRLYRAVVIGSGAHGVAVRRMLSSVARRSIVLDTARSPR